MSLPNRVDPLGDMHSVPERGTLTGNRGCLVDDQGRFIRRQQTQAWIYCRLSYRGWRHPLNKARTWTPLFFLDRDTALAAGHRPCGLCRREELVAYKEAVGLSAPDIDRCLARQRRVAINDKPMIELGAAPSGAIVMADGVPSLVSPLGLRPFSFAGWGEAAPHYPDEASPVLTPPLSLRALADRAFAHLSQGG